MLYLVEGSWFASYSWPWNWMLMISMYIAHFLCGYNEIHLTLSLLTVTNPKLINFPKSQNG